MVGFRTTSAAQDLAYHAGNSLIHIENFHYRGLGMRWPRRYGTNKKKADTMCVGPF